eukprot:6477771-Amphidinium_carterae.1
MSASCPLATLGMQANQLLRVEWKSRSRWEAFLLVPALVSFGLAAAAFQRSTKVGKEYYTFWFTTDVALPSEASSLWLQFKGINYRATAYADGQLLGSMATAFAEHWFQVKLSML